VATLGKDRLKGEGRKLKPIRYGPFKIIKQYGDNAFQLELPPYMQLYSVVNVEHLKNFEPSMLDEDEEAIILLPQMEELELVKELHLETDTIVETKTIETRGGAKVRYRIGKKGHIASKAKWYTREAAQLAFPELVK
jgi:hypothetical protein